MTEAPDLERVGQRVEQLLEQVGAAEPAAAEAATELVSELLGLYGAGLARILGVLEEAAPDAIAALADDPLVAGLLALHDLHPVDVETRVQQALDGVRPYLGSHGGDVELVAVEGDVARLRLTGSCNGCGASAITLQHAVEGAVLEAAPEIARLEVEGAVEPDGLIPPSALTAGRRDAPHTTWTTLDGVELRPGQLTGWDVEGQRIVVGRVGTDLYAYRDACPTCKSSLDGARVEGEVTACPACASRYDVRLAGRPVAGDGPALQPVPLIEDLGGVRVALGAAT